MSKIILPENLNGFKIYMIGIKGTGMAALAEILVSRGAEVSGSDVPEDFYTAKSLKKLNIKIFSPFNEENIPQDVQLIIFSAAYSPDNNEEMYAVQQKNIPALSYPEALGALSKYSFSAGISGVHGKTTTTGMTGTILKELKLPVSVLAGSVIANFNNSCTMLNGSKYFVAETCEYKRHFLNFHPRKIILTSVEPDHQDYYPTYESILTAFLQYADKLPQFGELFYCADDEGACEAAKLMFASRPDLSYIPYGEKAIGDYKITVHGVKNEKLSFSLAGFAGEFSLQIPGKHNVLNAAAAIALSISLLKEEHGELKIADMSAIRKAVSSYRGASRRTEFIGKAKNKDILVYDDYAHHPTAIKTLLKGLKEFYPDRRIIADFMAHTYSRTEALIDEFASCFTDADIVILHKIFSSAREKYSGQVDAELLFNKTKKHHKNVFFFNEVLDAKDFLLGKLRNGDLFITIGAGENYILSKEILKKENNL
ncbi:UDP-N-acetylmuramate--L-alanine ligase [Treponema pedis]|uniref:UDP-N-acetylmuramate--L-alanine ligase n=1 Tax=Treponema pedis TaxID=409322 RepID=UPI0003FA055C|nr:UDP-N-acetylmuramate--L-alanine ligase [Treponema pedis]